MLILYHLSDLFFVDSLGISAQNIISVLRNNFSSSFPILDAFLTFPTYNEFVGMLLIAFGLTGNVFISPSFSEDNFARYRVLDG
jgi:hypothetical protein